jgi:hypothetical protein
MAYFTGLDRAFTPCSPKTFDRGLRNVHAFVLLSNINLWRDYWPAKICSKPDKISAEPKKPLGFLASTSS